MDLDSRAITCTRSAQVTPHTELYDPLTFGRLSGFNVEAVTNPVTLREIEVPAESDDAPAVDGTRLPRE